MVLETHEIIFNLFVHLQIPITECSVCSRWVTRWWTRPRWQTLTGPLWTLCSGTPSYCELRAYSWTCIELSWSRVYWVASVHNYVLLYASHSSLCMYNACVLHVLKRLCTSFLSPEMVGPDFSLEVEVYCSVPVEEISAKSSTPIRMLKKLRSKTQVSLTCWHTLTHVYQIGV